jgi:hypothetical protein
MPIYSTTRAAAWAALLLTTLVCIGVAVAGSAHPAPAGSIQLLADANKRFSISGVVESVSYVSNSMRVAADGQTLEIEITPTTAIEMRGETGSISDIRRGAKVSVSGVIRDHDWIANSVVIH